MLETLKSLLVFTSQSLWSVSFVHTRLVQHQRVWLCKENCIKLSRILFLLGTVVGEKIFDVLPKTIFEYRDKSFRGKAKHKMIDFDLVLKSKSQLIFSKISSHRKAIKCYFFMFSIFFVWEKVQKRNEHTRLLFLF